MALPIKSTPVLKGKDAKKFQCDIDSYGNKVTQEDYERARIIYLKFIKKLNREFKND